MSDKANNETTVEHISPEKAFDMVRYHFGKELAKLIFPADNGLPIAFALGMFKSSWTGPIEHFVLIENAVNYIYDNRGTPNAVRTHPNGETCFTASEYEHWLKEQR